MLTLRQQIGQMLIMGFHGPDVEPASPVYEWLVKDGLGGVILFDRDAVTNLPGKNLANLNQIVRLTTQLRQCAKDNSTSIAKVPLFIGIDYEGGAVDRLNSIDGCPKTLMPEQLAMLPDIEFIKQATQMANVLKHLGFNLNFAPLLDLNLNKAEGIIGKLGRSFSSDPIDVTKYAALFVKAFTEQGITCCYKHFPGHGSALGDTHQDFVDVTETFNEKELTPYQSLLAPDQLPAMVMTAHVINRYLEPSGLPATLSKPILTDLLRNEFNFDGVIVSDDLQMHAISHYFSMEETLCLSINAGADMLIYANQLGNHNATEVIDVIERLVKEGAIPLSRITESYKRIMRLKQVQCATRRLLSFRQGASERGEGVYK